MSNSNKDQFDMSDLGASLPAAAAALSAEDRAGLVNALKNKLQNLAGQHSDILETLTPQVRKRVDVLRELQSQHDELESQFFEERSALEAKYQKLYAPLYTKRYEIVNGVVEVEGVNEALMNQGEDKEAENEKGVPNFWLTAMKTNEILAEEISERDEEALKYLKDIKWCKIDDRKGFKLEFFFDTNPFFTNSVLTKTYHMIDDDDPILEKAIGTKIDWCPGKCLTQKILKKKPKKGSKNAKPIIKTENCESFFNFFKPPQVPEDDDDDDIDEDAAEELQNLMEQDYDIGSTIRDKIIPHAVSWFTGEAAEADEFEDIEDATADDDDEDEDEEDEEDEDDEEEEKSKKKSSALKKRSKAQVGEGQQGERPPECKQQ
uniref:Nucleosome assembly protein 14-like isoform X1 n=1 Tax=Nicotiana tabacum TaxID=4097 RepID=A0A1S4DGY5_TOBAC|nr:nucleosome assembly protein 1;4 isoform X1 [Nicotiana tomentosiformis]XP_016512611.1 PREDICTED: nucleosome assembly protein 1;4-like isoform X1 [Nicotiana tabacum]